MVYPRARLAVAACLFAGWLLYLLYLVIVTRDLIVVSRPQMLVSQLCVRAQIDELDGRPKHTVTVLEVVWPARAKAELTDTAIDLSDLPDLGAAQGWTGPGVYLLALNRAPGAKEAGYYLTPLPEIPGFHASRSVILLEAGKDKDQVAGHLHKALAMEMQRAKDLVGDAPVVVRRFVPADDAYRLKEELSALGAMVDVKRDETRIYRATDDVLRQFREVKPD